MMTMTMMLIAKLILEPPKRRAWYYETQAVAVDVAGGGSVDTHVETCNADAVPGGKGLSIWLGQSMPGLERARSSVGGRINRQQAETRGGVAIYDDRGKAPGRPTTLKLQGAAGGVRVRVRVMGDGRWELRSVRLFRVRRRR